MARPALIRDPRVVPVAGTDQHLPAVPADRLTAAAVRARLAAPPDWQLELPGDGGRLHTDRAPASASVLVPLVERAGALSVLLTRRTDHLRDHAGQISFPGGRVEPDDTDEIATALREAEEEVGLARARVQVIGRMPVYTTVTSFVVTPVVGLIEPPLDLHELTLDPFEVAEVFEVPLAFLMNPAHHQRHVFEQGGERRQFLSMPWRSAAATGAERDYFIWGATAAMLRNFYRLLAA